MNREYHRRYSQSLGRGMELLVFGRAGLPVLVFPTSCGRFFEFEDRGMVDAIAGKIDAGHIQLFCVDSVDDGSWYNLGVPPSWRIARHVQYERYLMQEVLPLMRSLNPDARVTAIGCSFGGFHAANVALRHPDVFGGFLSMGGAFDLQGFLDGYHDLDCYFHLPLNYIPNQSDPRYLELYRRNTYVLATGVHDQCWNDNELLARAMRSRGIPVRLDVWGDSAGHDWPWWKRMLAGYL